MQVKPKPLQLLLCPHPTLLLPFADNLRQPMPKGIIYNLLDYRELIDWTGRQIRENKTGSIDGNAPPILLRIDIAPEPVSYTHLTLPTIYSV